MAGFHPKWGFDFNDHACRTWNLNFPGATIYRMSADEFIQLGKGNDKMKVDILHLSPPCQYFSPANTTGDKNDIANLASLFACRQILEAVRPRVATLEQTFGIVQLVRFQAYFRALVLMFTDIGYSVRWKVAFLQDWVCFILKASLRNTILTIT
jgi:DNA (cytosine-5)-methyltransferase 1